MMNLFLKTKFPATVSVAVKITAIYFAVGIVWILFSDAALGLVVRDPSVMTKLAIAKGCFYVSLTALMLYVLVRRGTAEIESSRLNIVEAVTRERQRLFDIIETLPMMVCLLKPDYKVVFVNRSFRDKYGEAHNRPCYEHRFGNPEPCSFCETTEVLKTGLPHHWEFTGPDGSVIDAYDFPFTDVDGSPMILEMHIDITERRRAEEKIRQQEIELRQVLDFAPQLVAVFGPDRERLYANGPALDYFGITLEEWQSIPDRFWFFHPDDRERVATGVYTGAGSDLPHEFEARMRRKDGAHRWFLFRDNPLRDDQGRIMRWYLSATDIEDRKSAEETLSRLNRELRAISNCNQVLLRATDEQSLLEEICRIVCEEAGYRMAWVGYAEHDDARSVRPVAWTGAEEGYLATANITWADTERGRGPAGIAIRSGESCYIQDNATDPRFTPWRESALQRGYRSGIVLPLKDEHAEAFGCLCIYSGQTEAFTPEEIRLLEELAADLEFGIVALRSRAARKQAEQEVALLSFALDKISEAAFLTDDTGCFQYVNEESCRVLGYTRSELLCMGVSDIDPEFPAERRSDLWRDLKTRPSVSFESRHQTRNGHIFPVEVSANFFEYEGRAYNLALARDITERKQAEEALRRTKFYLAEGERLSHTGSWAVDLDKYVYCSEEDLRIWGLDPHGPLPTREAVFQQMHPEDWDRVEESFQKTFREKVDTSCEYRILLPDGSVRHVHVIRHPVLNEAGEVFQLVGTTIDITERKRAEEALRIAGVYNRSLIEASIDPLVTIDPQGRISDVNAATEHATGYARSELIGTDFSDYFTEPEKARAGYQQVFEEGFVRDYELEIRNRNGQITPVLYNASVYRDDTGTVIGVFAAARDITELKRAEEARSMLAAIVESSDDAIISKNLDGTIMSWNEGAERLYGYSAAEALGRSVTILSPPDQQDEIADILKRIREGIGIEHFETERVRRDGRKIDVSLSLSPVRNYRGQVIGASAIARDITELKRAQNEVLSHLRFFQDMDRINRAMQGTNDLEQMMGEILDAMLLIFDSDRAWLVYPCDPDANSWRVLMERTKPEYPGGFALADDVPMNPDTRMRFQLIANGPGAVTFGPGCDYPLSGEIPERFGHKSQISIALCPKTGKPWVLGMQHCSYPRVWTRDEKKLLEEIARRASDVLTGLLAHRDLHESEERHRVILQTAMDGFFRTDVQGRILEVNETYCRMSGYNEQELLTMNVADISAVRAAAAIEADIRRFAEVGPQRFESVHRRKDGSLFDVEISGQYHPITGGQAVVFVRDITERKRAEEALRQSEAYLAEAQSLSHTGCWALDLASGEVYSSDENSRIYGFDPQGSPPSWKAALERVHPEDLDRVKECVEKSLREKVATSNEHRIVLPDGTLKHIHATRRPVLNDAGDVVKLVGTLIDITERKRAEEALRQSEAYLTEAQRLSHTGSWALDVASGNYDYWSEETFRIYEFDPREGLPTKEAVYRRIHPDDWNGAEESFQKSIREKIDTLDDFRTVLPSGTVKHVQVIRHPILNDAGEVIRLVGTAMDVTERKRAEDALRLAGVYNRSLIEASLDPLVTIDPEGRISDVNAATEKVTGYTRSELIGTNFSDYFTKPEKAKSVYRKVFNEGLVRDYELNIRHRDGRMTPVLCNASVYRDEAGKVIGIFAAARDITERKQAQEALQKLLADLELRVEERTKALSEANQSLRAANKELESFSYSVSHDLRAPLRAIDGFSMMVLKDYADKLDDEGRRKLDVIRSNTQQMGRLIDDLLAFSRMGRKEMVNASLDMEAIVRIAWRELIQLNPERRIQFSVQGLPHGMGDQTLIKEVVANLLSNAIKFSKYRENAIVEVGAWPAGKEMNVYFVKDNGVGFDMQYYDKIFGVFQRLHSADEFEGTGVGLAIVERIISRHGGRVWAEGKEGEGATFYFTLPRRGDG